MSRDWSEEYLDETCCLKIYTGQLEKKLAIAIKALEKIHRGYSKEYNMAGEVADKALKQIKEVSK